MLRKISSSVFFYRLVQSIPHGIIKWMNSSIAEKSNKLNWNLQHMPLIRSFSHFVKILATPPTKFQRLDKIYIVLQRQIQFAFSLSLFLSFCVIKFSPAQTLIIFPLRLVPKMGLIDQNLWLHTKINWEHFCFPNSLHIKSQPTMDTQKN